MISLKRVGNIKPEITIKSDVTFNTLPDKRLLQLAAQALDIYVDFAGYTDSRGPWREGDEEWNPLRHDRDAFCLLTDLHLNLDSRGTKVRAYHDELSLGIELFFDYGNDKRAATRRAIVACATTLIKKECVDLIE